MTFDLLSINILRCFEVCLYDLVCVYIGATAIVVFAYSSLGIDINVIIMLATKEHVKGMLSEIHLYLALNSDQTIETKESFEADSNNNLHLLR